MCSVDRSPLPSSNGKPWEYDETGNFRDAEARGWEIAEAFREGTLTLTGLDFCYFWNTWLNNED